jgi:DNA-binding NarL/FixJ family response regulator
MAFTFAIASHQLLLRSLLGEYIVRKTGARVVGEYGNCAELAQKGAALKNADLLLMDCDLPGADALATVKSLLDRKALRKVLLLSDFDGGFHAHQALQLGLHGVIHKRDCPKLIDAALDNVLAGGLFFSPQVAAAERTLFIRVLSSREIEVLREFAQGHKAEAVAARLGLAPATVKTHKRNAFSKLQLRSQAALVVFALRHGVIRLDEAENAITPQR